MVIVADDVLHCYGTGKDFTEAFAEWRASARETVAMLDSTPCSPRLARGSG